MLFLQEDEILTEEEDVNYLKKNKPRNTSI